jgi:P pilus assembly chaperone PapD
MIKINTLKRTLLLAPALFLAAPAQAAGDLLVAPTRVVLDGARGTEIILNNIGADPATYRISLELRRMTAEGNLAEVTAPSAEEQAALSMITYAPRRVTLAPNQPQAVRVGVRAPEGLPPGEYRVHMLFRAVQDAKPATAKPAPASGLTIALTPIYGITIPVIVRFGALDAKASISNAKIVTEGGRQAVSFDLARTGDRSLYGEVRVLKPGHDKPVVLVRGIAVYKEIGSRNVTLPVMPEVTGSIAGPATIQYAELREDGGRVLAEAQVVLK